MLSLAGLNFSLGFSSENTSRPATITEPPQKESASQHKAHGAGLIADITSSSQEASTYVSNLPSSCDRDKICLHSQANLLVRDLANSLCDLQRISINNYSVKNNFDIIQNAIKSLSAVVYSIQNSLNDDDLQVKLAAAIQNLPGELEKVIEAVNEENEYNQVLITVLESINTSIIKISTRCEIRNYNPKTISEYVEKWHTQEISEIKNFPTQNSKAQQQLVRYSNRALMQIMCLVEDIRKEIENLEYDGTTILQEIANSLSKMVEEIDEQTKSNSNLSNVMNDLCKIGCVTLNFSSKLLGKLMENLNLTEPSGIVVNDILLTAVVNIVAVKRGFINGLVRLSGTLQVSANV